MMTAATSAHALSVPGARLHYEITGAGPLLLLVGSPMGSRGFAPLIPLLATEFTVVTYDPRGILNSTLDDPAQDATPDLLADDVHRLIAALERGPAYVFGNSGGGATALALLTNHPSQVRALVVHEPPLIELLPDSGEARRALHEICDSYLGGDRQGALRKYTALTGIRFGPPSAPGVAVAESFTPPADVWAILDRFFLHILRPTTRYRPNQNALRAFSARIVVAGGSTSKGQLYHRAAVALAGELGLGPVFDFPDGHTGFQTEPEQFVHVLSQVLARFS